MKFPFHLLRLPLVVALLAAQSTPAQLVALGQTPRMLFGYPLRTHPPGGTEPTQGATPDTSLAIYTYMSPAQWTRQESQGGIVLISPMYGNGEKCQITMLLLRSSSRPLGDEAIDTFRRIFKTDPLTSYPSPPPKLASGLSPQGWEYFTVRKLVGGQEGEARTMGVILMLVKLDNQVATIVGTSRDFLVSQCFGELSTNVWPMFFYSIQFKNVPLSERAQAVVQRQLVGTWTVATSHLGLQYTFQANGRYASTGATRYASPEITQAFSGDGAYSLIGNVITFTSNENKRSIQRFRLEQVSKDSGRSWQGELCLLELGSPGEVCYHRQ